MKSFTSIEQSKILAKILPIESADMFYLKIPNSSSVGYNYSDLPYFAILGMKDNLPAWSLAALLDILQKTAYLIDEDSNVMLESYKTVEWDLGIDNSDLELITESNPVDACYEMISKLHEDGLL